MFRRLCIDVDADGTLLGASVEFYSDTKLERNYVLVMEPGWVESRTLLEAIVDLEVDGWMSPPLRILD